MLNCVLVQEIAVLPGNEVLISPSQLFNALADCAGRFESGFLCNLFQRATLIAELQNQFVLLGQLILELLHALFGKYRGFKLAPGIGNVIKLFIVDVYTVFQHVLQRNVFCGTAVIPRAHEITLLDVLSGVIRNLTIVPDFVNHRLPVLFLHNPIRQIANQIAELLVAEPWQLRILVHQEQPLEAPFQVRLKLLSEMLDDFIGQPPERKVAGVV